MIITRHFNGTVDKQYTLEAGKLHGQYFSYNAQGVLLNRCYFSAGQLKGFSYSYDEQGKLLQKARYVAGKREGRCLTYSYGWVIAQYRSGQLHGVKKCFDSNRQLVSKENYVAELRTGTAFYYCDGKLFQRLKFVTGKQHGLAITFAGDQLRIQYFSAGQLSQSFDSWVVPLYFIVGLAQGNWVYLLRLLLG